MKHKIFVSVQAGVAEVCEETVPAGIVVEILDFDNFAANPGLPAILCSRAGQRCVTQLSDFEIQLFR